jgi:hypothetical protein
MTRLRVARRLSVCTVDKRFVPRDCAPLITSDGEAVTGLATAWPAAKRCLPAEVSIVHTASHLAVVESIPRAAAPLFADALKKFDWTKRKPVDVLPVEALVALLSEVFTATGVRSMAVNPVSYRRRMAGRLERAVADAVGGKVNKGSGNSLGHRRDVTSAIVLVEVKDTVEKSHSVVLEDLRYLGNQAMKAGKVPVYTINFSKENYSVIVVRREDLAEEELIGTTELQLAASGASVTINCAWLRELHTCGKAGAFTYCGRVYEVHPFSLLLSMTRRSEELVGTGESKGRG